MAQITLTDVQKVYGKTIALQNFSVTVADGEFVTFLGPSGCGKTTSLRLVAGFIRPESGSVRIAERIVSDASKGVFVPPEDRGVGMVFQSYAVWPHMNVFKNVAYPLRIKKVQRAEMTRRVEAGFAAGEDARADRPLSQSAIRRAAAESRAGTGAGHESSGAAAR